MNYSLTPFLGLLFALTFSFEIFAVETGAVASDCALTTLGDAKTYDTKQFEGKVIYMDFWASWCGPCAKSFPFMNELHRDLKDKGLKVVGVNLDENADDAKAFLAKYPVNFTIAADVGGQCAENYEVKAMPSSYLIGRDGVIRHVHLGFRPGEAKELRELVEQLLAEKPAIK